MDIPRHFPSAVLSMGAVLASATGWASLCGDSGECMKHLREEQATASPFDSVLYSSTNDQGGTIVMDFASFGTVLR